MRDLMQVGRDAPWIDSDAVARNVAAQLTPALLLLSDNDFRRALSSGQLARLGFAEPLAGWVLSKIDDEHLSPAMLTALKDGYNDLCTVHLSQRERVRDAVAAIVHFERKKAEL